MNIIFPFQDLVEAWPPLRRMEPLFTTTERHRAAPIELLSTLSGNSITIFERIGNGIVIYLPHKKDLYIHQKIQNTHIDRC